MAKTASDLKKSGWPIDEMKKYHPWDSIEKYSKDKDVITRRKLALKTSRKLARLLKEKYGAKRVVLFGSLAKDDWYTPRSDIDICVKGIPVDKFFYAESEIQSSSEGFKVDLVDPDECSPELLAKIDRDGIDL